jgi:hypothetical protein
MLDQESDALGKQPGRRKIKKHKTRERDKESRNQQKGSQEVSSREKDKQIGKKRKR